MAPRHAVVLQYTRIQYAPVAQGIERLPPEQKAAGSNPVRGTHLARHQHLTSWPES